MFSSIESVYGARFWENVLLVVSSESNSREKRNFERWISKLEEKFPWACKRKVKQVYIDTAEHEFDTLEQVWNSICHLPRYLIHQFKVGEEEEEDVGDKDPGSQDGEARAYTPDISNSSDLLSSHIDLASSRTDLASSRTDLASSRTDLASSGTYLASSRSDLSSSRTDLSYTRPESRISRSDLLLDLPYMPPLPPRSPTFTRRRSYQPPRSVPSTSRLPRSYMPSSFPTDEFSYSRYSNHSTPRFGRRSLREISPISSYSCRSSRETSPAGGGFKTVGIPTYLRTCNAYKHSFTKAMRESRLALSYASEDRILLDKAEDIPYPQLENLDSVLRLSCDADLLYITHQIYDFPPNLETTKDLLPEQYMTAQSLLETEYLVGVAGALVESRVEEEVEELAEQKVETYKARRSSIKDLSSELMTPDILVTKNPYNYVRKAVLPRIKLHWDQGFRQGTTGWEKVPVIKIKIKYNEEDLDILPKYISIEGGRWCETKRIRLEGFKAKCKLRATQGPEFQVRMVPLDSDLKPESWVPEFLVSIPPSIQGEGEEPEKWIRTPVHPCIPE
ncbi:uncharacterized protein LOC111707587 isoform X2 [Eurytemora carolleeae]|nr:uncharacterized protein LOC111707587 isoform X2 [Eurytemora carolleeae]|eukprot:XP_023336482.1 uncharacterized protein LOC111707587 isoform X2 [Eurytemora affinis]